MSRPVRSHLTLFCSLCGVVLLLQASCAHRGQKSKADATPPPIRTDSVAAAPVKRERQRGDILPGDSIRIAGPADGKEFSTIELYTKSRFAPVPYTWDSVSGEGFYEYWFTVGDFDSRALPLEYMNKWVRIISIKPFRDRENNMMTVFFCKGKGEHDVLWVPIERAVLSGEAELPQP